MTFAPNTPFGVVATRYTPSRYCVLVVVPSASPNGPSSHVFQPGCCDGSTERKYSSGKPATPVPASARHNRVLPLRWFAQTRNDLVGTDADTRTDCPDG